MEDTSSEEDNREPVRSWLFELVSASVAFLEAFGDGGACVVDIERSSDFKFSKVLGEVAEEEEDEDEEEEWTGEMKAPLPFKEEELSGVRS